MKKIIYIAIFFVACTYGLFACSDPKDSYSYEEPISYDWSLAADSATTALIDKFWNESDHYFNYANNGKDLTFHYWPNAHAMDVIIDAYLRTKDEKYLTYFDQWYDGVKMKNGNTYFNDFVDDMQWNALTMIRMYQTTQKDKYLNTAKELWNRIKEAWSDDAGGGILWSYAPGIGCSKNACSNGPAAIIAARMYKITQDEEDLNWAKKIFEWEKQTLVDSSIGKVYDNINCNSLQIEDLSLTYNQGTYVGAAVELFNITKDFVYLNDAKQAALFTLSSLINTSNNVLRNEGEGDGGLFKGIFIRYFLELIKVEELEPAYKKKFITSFNHNVYILWNSAVYKTGSYDDDLLFGPSWDTAPLGFTQLTSQASGCMMMEAKATLELLNK
ncbi:glycoside hydrolase family 76 [Bacteroides coprosuis DSM 18011]|uniref:Glycoside hydrolase family 76 n=1 Tax=Bacteroides coprosuis DSM 18011 TaxID=679937 RepID=F3ZND0_9BACE|nr:glycoside hydrolase family 76 protein [Bacteroides coprosuis]EGJ71470.1 glycoside hydrolase family 76 [Bacteroides coprosuis DSM 18011]